MGKKKPFIDKKNSSTYHVLHRSQRDIADGDSGIVLWPSPNNNQETDQKVLLGSTNNVTQLKDETLLDWKTELSKAGLVDELDYEKHLKPITGTGQYLSNSVVPAKQKEISAMLDARALSVQEEIVKEVDRQLDSIALTADCMDEDIAQALFGEFDDGDFEELNDEFVLDAAQEPSEEVDGENGGFDFATHIKGLMDKARSEYRSDDTKGHLSTIHELGQQDHEFFSKARPIEKGNDDDGDDESGYLDESDVEIEGTPGVVPKLSVEEEQALCDKFNATLAEYDSDELGEGCDDDDVFGNRPLEGDYQVEAALNDFLQEKQDDIFIKGARQYMDGPRTGGSGFSALVGTRMIPAKEVMEPSSDQRSSAEIRPISDVLGEADETLGKPYQAPPSEEIFIDGKSYFSEKIRNPWDCESILSTYSNLDNNPVIISGGNSRRRKRKPPKLLKSSSAQEQIILSEKTGLPLGALSSSGEGDGDYYEENDYADTCVSVNKGEARRKDESVEEKRLRKLNVKKERQVARMQKKMMKEAFNDEFSKRQHEVLVDDVGGKSVFRF